MKKSVHNAESFYNTVRLNPAITKEESKAHIEVLEGIEAETVQRLNADNVKGIKRDRVLLWNGAILGFLLALKAIKRAGDATLAAEGKLREN